MCLHITFSTLLMGPGFEWSIKTIEKLIFSGSHFPLHVCGWMVCSCVCTRSEMTQSGAFLNCFPHNFFEIASVTKPGAHQVICTSYAVRAGDPLASSLALRFWACRTKPSLLWVHWRPCACSHTCMTRGSPTVPWSQPGVTLSKRPVSQFLGMRYCG